MTFVLRYTNQYGQRYWFANLGGFWPHDQTKRLIERTVPDPADARKFDTEEDANTTLVTAGQPRGWEIVEL